MQQRARRARQAFPLSRTRLHSFLRSLTPAALVQAEPPTPPKLDLEHLPNEILDIIFAEAAKGYSYAQKLQLCLISKRLRPRGQHILYEELDFANTQKRPELRVAGPKAWAKSREREVSASRSVSFLENLLPKLKAPQIQSTKHISLELSFAGCPLLWAVRELRKLFRVFRLSKAHLYLLVSPTFVNTDFISLLAIEEMSAFAGVKVEVVDAANCSARANDHKIPTHVVLIETPTCTSAGAFPECNVWTQHADLRNALKLQVDSSSVRGVYLSAPQHTMGGFSLFRSLSQAARPRVSSVYIWPSRDSSCSMPPLDDFPDKESVMIDFRLARYDPAQTVALLRSLVLPTVKKLYVNFSVPRPSLGELFLLWHDSTWAASVQYFGWRYEYNDGKNREEATPAGYLNLTDAGGSWLKDFSRVMEERRATLGIWDGKSYVEAAPHPYQAGV